MPVLNFSHEETGLRWMAVIFVLCGEVTSCIPQALWDGMCVGASGSFRVRLLGGPLLALRPQENP